MEKQSLYHLVRDAVDTFSDRPVYWVKDAKKSFRAISYRNWYADMRRFSCYLLHQLAISHGDRVALICDNRYEWNLICLGIDTIGAVDVPSGCDVSHKDIEHILNHTLAQVIVIENQKVLDKIIDVLPKLNQLKHILSIEPPEHYKKLEQVQENLDGKVQLHFLIDALTIGEELLEHNSAQLLKERQESLESYDLATIIYTSGTTGTPKGVMLSHRNFCWSVSQVQKVVHVNEFDRTVIFLPPWQITERILEVVLISFGASMASSRISSLLSDFSIIKPTVLLSVPRVWDNFYEKIFTEIKKTSEFSRKTFFFAQHVATTYTDILDTIEDRFAEWQKESHKQKLFRKAIAYTMLPFYAPLYQPAKFILRRVIRITGGDLRFAISGAGAMSENVNLFFRSVGIPILDAYGMTETTGLGILSDIPYPRRGAVGKPFANAEIQLKDDNDNIITHPGEKGIAYHKGPHIMQGYYKDEEKTKEVFKDGWLNSGDIFIWTFTGELRFIGRKKDTIVLLSGENVEPSYIEEILKESDYIDQIIVVGQDKKHLGALIYPNQRQTIETYQESGKILDEDLSNWNQNKEVCNFYRNIIREKTSLQNEFRPFERVTAFRFLNKKFEIGNELTHTMKIKRDVVHELYANEIEEMFH